MGLKNTVVEFLAKIVSHVAIIEKIYIVRNLRRLKNN